MAETKVSYIILLIAFLAALAESLPAPFYPQIFKEVYGVSDPEYTGTYLCILRLTFMLSYPLWAIVTKKVNTFKLLSTTQFIAGALSIYCGITKDLSTFYIISVLVVFFKSSYLLLYPYLINRSENKTATITKLGILVHLSMIISALSGASFIKQVSFQGIFIIIGVFDFVQMAISFMLFNQKSDAMQQKQTSDVISINKVRVVWICIFTFVFYFLSTLIRPFYTEFILNEYGNALGFEWAALLFILPSISAVLLLPFSKKKIFLKNPIYITALILVLNLSLVLQSQGSSLVMECISRFIYGIVLFQMFVHLDSIFFEETSQTNSTTAYSIIHITQNAAYMTGPLMAGYLVGHINHGAPFWVAALLGLTGIPIALLIQFKKPQKYSTNLKPNLS